MYILKIAIGLGVLSIGGAGTYMTYDYLSKKDNEDKGTNNQVSKGQAASTGGDQQEGTGLSSAA